MDRGAVGFALSGLLLVIAGMATPGWLDYLTTDAQNAVTDRAYVGLWKAEFHPNVEIKFADGKAADSQYDWYFDSWMNACR